ncbi:MAG: tRNA dihydrouridine synthase DusB [Candidatus Marinimicrobia bacterium]|nr:tRNA dihydrouridine synthase DusB [Candidatus Neomarinimicrobiota bacterium]
MKIGNIDIKNSILLAPMAGVTDLPFRIICKDMGADLVYTEFVSSNGIIRENKKTLDLIEFIDEERPIGVQIFGETPEAVGLSAKMIEERFSPDIIDINYGCPVPKVTKKGAGSAALKDLNLMRDITSAVVEKVKDTPVTVKMRSGWCSDSEVFVKAGQILEEVGVSAITLHPRTTSQRFEGSADWNSIKVLKENVNIPVIGNGDVKTIDDYIKILKQTKCDAVMIGRAALGNPWIFRDINNYNKGNAKKETKISDILTICIKHYNLLKENKEERICVNLTKKHFSWYLKGFKNASYWRKKILFSKDISQIEETINIMEKELV